MNKSVREHVARIREAITRLESEFKGLKDPAEKLKTESDIRSLKLALMHYELALEIEHEVIGGRSARGMTSFAA